MMPTYLLIYSDVVDSGIVMLTEIVDMPRGGQDIHRA